MAHRRIENTTSMTAQYTCMSRAASCLEPDGCYHGEDRIALKLLPTLLRLSMHIPWVRRYFTRRMAPMGIYEYTIARTRYIDAVFKEVLAAGVDQIVIFGAGFDTRALRLLTGYPTVKIFELDMPVTQKAKLGQYAKRKLDIPANVTFIPMDFDKESLPEKLAAAGCRKGVMTLFLLEGLLMYLQPSSVDETFKVIEAFAGPGSTVIFDYVQASVLRQEGTCFGESDILKSVAKAGEQWHFGLEPDRLYQFLKKFGLTAAEHKQAQDLERMYFTDADGKVVGHLNGTHCLVKAVSL
jgi:methyltransferase (TIGR00027 family)